jgi:hypothetical protein
MGFLPASSSRKSTAILTGAQRYSTMTTDSSFLCVPVYRTTYTLLHRGSQEVLTMQESIDTSLVRIYTADGRVVGAGFLVGERHILTCAHIVATSLTWLVLLSIHHQESSCSTIHAFLRMCSLPPWSSCGVPRFPKAVAILQAWNSSAERQSGPMRYVSLQRSMCGNMTSMYSAFPKATMMGCGPPDSCFVRVNIGNIPHREVFLV